MQTLYADKKHPKTIKYRTTQLQLVISEQCVRYADNGADPGGDGLSFETAMNSVEEAIASAGHAVEETGKTCEVIVRENTPIPDNIEIDGDGRIQDGVFLRTHADDAWSTSSEGLQSSLTKTGLTDEETLHSRFSSMSTGTHSSTTTNPANGSMSTDIPETGFNLQSGTRAVGVFTDYVSITNSVFPYLRLTKTSNTDVSWDLANLRDIIQKLRTDARSLHLLEKDTL